MTREAGTISGARDITLDPDGYGLVRYRDTEDWYTIGNLDDTTPRTWPDCTTLADAIAEVSGTHDAAGNTVVFEC